MSEAAVGTTTTATTEIAVGSTTPAAGSVPASTDWTNGFNEDLKGYTTSKGFKDPSAVVDSYRNLEKLIGVKEKLLQVPDDLGSKDMDAVWNRLGRPEKAEGYSFKGADEGFDKWAKESFHKAGLTTNQAKSVIEQYDAYVSAQNTSFESNAKAGNEIKVNDLKKEWGNAFDQNVNVAKAAAKQFGISSEMVDSMEKSIGFADTMKFLNSVGAKLGEADFVTSTSTTGMSQSILSPSQAKDKLSSLTKDPEWSAKYLRGDVQAKNEMERLSKMATGTYST